MRLTTVVEDDGVRSAGRIEGEEIVLLPYADVGDLMSSASNWREIALAGGRTISREGAAIGRLISRPSKILCLSANDREHVREFDPDKAMPSFPEIFAKYPESLTGPYDDIQFTPGTGATDYQSAIAAAAAFSVFDQPSAPDCVDWEAELVVVIGATVRRASEEEAAAAIGGFTVGNDVSVRDWLRTSELLQSKAWEAMSPVGPTLVTADELGGPRPDLRVRCVIDDVVRQDFRLNPVFDPVEAVCYISRFITLRPGDLIFMGSGPGIGISMHPQVYIRPGQVMITEIEGIGRMVNLFVAEDVAGCDDRRVTGEPSKVRGVGAN